jgi:predicted  nucleic acid-binding Zn-ribbon protein
MLAARQKVAAGEVVKLRNSKLKNDVSTIREQIMAVRNQYNEASATLRDLGKKLAYIARLESDIDRLKQRAGELEAQMLRVRVSMGSPPLTLHSPAELY